VLLVIWHRPGRLLFEKPPVNKSGTNQIFELVANLWGDYWHNRRFPGTDPCLLTEKRPPRSREWLACLQL
jgi:hypothetical protein